jgi:hypothetical protein
MRVAKLHLCRIMMMDAWCKVAPPWCHEGDCVAQLLLSGVKMIEGFCKDASLGCHDDGCALQSCKTSITFHTCKEPAAQALAG